MFLAGTVDKVRLIYTRFVSVGFQEVVLPPLVPLESELLARRRAARAAEAQADYEFEPSPAAILDALLPRYVEARIYAALLNAAASRARRPPAGHEGGHRQRRRAHPRPARAS